MTRCIKQIVRGLVAVTALNVFAVACEAPAASKTASDTPSTVADREAPRRVESFVTPPTTKSNSTVTQEPLTRYPAPSRLVAVGDVHGDLAATVEVLRLAGLIDEEHHWSGGDTVLVQTGDQLDRGDDEVEILALLDRLEAEAAQSGGFVHVLNGNHELMNVLGDFRYVTPAGFTAFERFQFDTSDRRLQQWPASQRARLAAMVPGGPFARRFATRNVVVIVGETVFVHGGVEPEYAAQVEAINRQTRALLRGDGGDSSEVIGQLMAPNGPIWSRRFSQPQVAPEDCAALDTTLTTLGVKRMVVGHTVQTHGVSSQCDQEVWRIDVGMARHYGGRPAALEIVGDVVRVLEKP